MTAARGGAGAGAGHGGGRGGQRRRGAEPRPERAGGRGAHPPLLLRVPRNTAGPPAQLPGSPGARARLGSPRTRPAAGAPSPRRSEFPGLGAARVLPQFAPPSAVSPVPLLARRGAPVLGNRLQAEGNRNSNNNNNNNNDHNGNTRAAPASAARPSSSGAGPGAHRGTAAPAPAPRIRGLPPRGARPCGTGEAAGPSGCRRARPAGTRQVPTPAGYPHQCVHTAPRVRGCRHPLDAGTYTPRPSSCFPANVLPVATDHIRVPIDVEVTSG